MDKAAWCLAHGMIHGDLNIYKAWTRSKINQLIVGGSRGMKSYCLKNYIFGLDFCEYCVTDRTKWLQAGYHNTGMGKLFSGTTGNRGPRWGH